MLVPSGLRDRLTKYFYTGANESDAVVRIEKCLALQIELDATLKKFQILQRNGKVSSLNNLAEQIHEARQIQELTAEEAQALLEFETLKQEVIRVNEFSFDLSLKT